MKIREAVSLDFDKVHKLIEELEDGFLEQTSLLSIFKEYLQRENSFVWVIEIEDGDIVGFLSCFGQRLLHHCDWVYEIQELIISKHHQGQGLGKIVIEKLVATLKEKNVFSLEVTTNKKRIHAHEFYKTVGFVNSHEKFTMYFK